MLQPSPLSPYPQLIRTPDPAIATFLHDKWAFFAVSHVKCPIQLPTHWLSSSSHKQPHLLLPHSRVIYAESEKANAKNYIYLKSYRKFFAEETPDTIQRATILPTIKLPSSWHEIYDKKAHSNKTNAKEKLWFFFVFSLWERMSIEDPYFVVRDEISQSVKQCEQKLAEWRVLMEVKNRDKVSHVTCL